ncbi:MULTISPECIES: hypothetical protein [unclassified Haematospirillum]|uniref:hypothetical protein n=1 Tax=unclassified Haematospirillum TaxID=2622088 RepID=UPI001439E572|nr:MULTISPECIES: hypothetical protein [unclassified Haematospirillum]NKD54324.1 hypothetical protein [Haematospirillum sp. H4890]NKD74368.1 hypothetical protein [Haematospirillum sp. H4485]NKD86961.1 hypothetical protein [Haematospirillum sp. 15-248]
MVASLLAAASAKEVRRSWTLDVDPAACRLQADLSSGGSANYVAGVDVHGQPVVTVDGDEAQTLNPDLTGKYIAIELETSLARRLSLTPLAEAKGYIGTITIKNQTILLNGEPLSYGGKDALREACQYNEHLYHGASSPKPAR